MLMYVEIRDSHKNKITERIPVEFQPTQGSYYTNPHTVTFKVETFGHTSEICFYHNVGEKTPFVISSLNANWGALSPGDEVHFAPGHLKMDLAFMKPPAQKPAPLPTHCAKCNHYNEYVGPEHIRNGQYICRSCRGQ